MQSPQNPTQEYINFLKGGLELLAALLAQEIEENAKNKKTISNMRRGLMATMSDSYEK